MFWRRTQGLEELWRQERLSTLELSKGKMGAPGGSGDTERVCGSLRPPGLSHLSLFFAQNLCFSPILQPESQTMAKKNSGTVLPSSDCAIVWPRKMPSQSHLIPHMTIARDK